MIDPFDDIVLLVSRAELTLEDVIRTMNRSNIVNFRVILFGFFKVSPVGFHQHYISNITT